MDISLEMELRVYVTTIMLDGLSDGKQTVQTIAAVNEGQWNETWTMRLTSTHRLTVFGMGLDVATLIAVMGTVYSGNPLSLEPGFSIGGESSKVGNILGDLFGLLGIGYSQVSELGVY